MRLTNYLANLATRAMQPLVRTILDSEITRLRAERDAALRAAEDAEECNRQLRSDLAAADKLARRRARKAEKKAGPPVWRDTAESEVEPCD